MSFDPTVGDDDYLDAYLALHRVPKRRRDEIRRRLDQQQRETDR